MNLAISPEYLLAHADFVRGLARKLILDDDLAEDVAQNTLLTALERPPSAVAALPAWLKTVTKNFAASTMRESARRERRERSVAPKGYVPSPADVLEREAVRKRVVDAVLGLDDTYRDAVLLRFYENLPPRHIAERLGVPVETVRTRLKRGLARLRDTLDSDYDGDRDSWCIALAPIAGIPWLVEALAASAGGNAAGATAAGTAGASQGGLLLSSKGGVAGTLGNAGGVTLGHKFAMGLGAALLVGITAVFSVVMYSSDEDALVPGYRSDTDRTHSAQPASAAPEGYPVFAIGEEAGGRELLGPEDREASSEEHLEISGQVVDQMTREPVESYFLVLEERTRRGFARSEMTANCLSGTTIRDEAGRFSIPVPESGAYTLKVYSKDHVNRVEDYVEVPGDRPATPRLIALDLGKAVSGRVVNERNGRPVPHAMVAVTEKDLPKSLSRLLRPRLFGKSPIGPHSWTDEDGRFTVSGAHGSEAILWVVHDEFQVWKTPLRDIANAEALAKLKQGIRVPGRFLGIGFNDPVLEKTLLDRVVLWVDDRPFRAGPDGRFLSPPLGEIEVQIFYELGVRWFLPRGHTLGDREFLSGKTLKRNVAPGMPEVLIGYEGPWAALKGRVLDRTGRAVSGGIFAFKTEDTFTTIRLPCDGEGRFEARYLAPGRYNAIYSSPPPKSKVTLGRFSIREGDTSERDFVLKGLSIKGRIQFEKEDFRAQDLSLSLTNISEPDRGELTCRMSDDGRFEFEGLEDGTFFLDCPKLEFSGIEKCRDAKLKDGRCLVYLKNGRSVENLLIKSRTDSGQLKVIFEGFDGWQAIDIIPSIRMDSPNADSGASTRETVPLRVRSTTMKNLAFKEVWNVDSSGGLKKWFDAPGIQEGREHCILEFVAGKRFAFLRVPVKRDEETVVLVKPSDFSQETVRVEIQGTLAWSGGTPIFDLPVHLLSEHPDDRYRNWIGYHDVTDLTGRYAIPSPVHPGPVFLRLDLCTMVWRVGPLIIPEEAKGTYILDVVLPRPGSLRALLTYDESGRTLTSARSQDLHVELVAADGSRNGRRLPKFHQTWAALHPRGAIGFVSDAYERRRIPAPGEGDPDS